MGPASFEVHHSVAHYIVDDDSDHVLMRMTIPGHLVKRKSKTKTTVSWRLDLLESRLTPIGPERTQPRGD
jgi:hypothetical protein